MLVGVGLSPGGRLERGCTEHAGGAPAHRSLCHFWQHAHNVAVMQALDACNVYIESIKEEVEGAHTRQICLRQATYAGLAMTGYGRASGIELFAANFGSSTSNHLRCSWLDQWGSELLACSIAAGETDVHWRRKSKHTFKDSRPQKSAVTHALASGSLLLLSLKTYPIQSGRGTHQRKIEISKIKSFTLLATSRRRGKATQAPTSECEPCISLHDEHDVP